MYTPLFLLFHYFLHIADPLLHTPPTQPPMWLLMCDMLTFTSPDWPCLFDGCMIYDSHVYSSPFSYLMHPPVARPIMNHHATWSGTYYSFALDEPCACFLVYHLYLTCLYLPFAPENCIYKFPQVCRFSAFTSPCLTFTSSHFASHHLTILLSLPVTPHLETIPYPQITPSESHRIYA